MAKPAPWRDAIRLGAAALVAFGLGLAGFGLATKPPSLDPSSFAFLSTDPRPSITAHNSPAVAVDPSNPDVMAVADKIDSPLINCTVSVSDDGGNSWSPSDPVPPDPDTRCYWPDVAFDAEGDLLVLYTAMLDNFNGSVGVFLQRYSGGRPAGAPVNVTGPKAFHARLAVDARRVLVTWVQVDADVPFQAGSAAASKLVVATSDDGGATFAPPVTVSDPGQLLLQPTVLVGKGGEIVVGALDLGTDLLDYESQHEGQNGEPYDGKWQVVTYTSGDGGATFGERTAVSDVVPPTRIYPDVSAPTPGFAVHPASGRIFATWDSGVGTARDVYLSWSDDAGRTWERPTQFSRRSSQTLPTVGVSSDGRVDLFFYDRSKDPTDVMTEPVLASSFDSGVTFSDRSASGRTFDSRIGFGSSQGLPSLGQQLGLISQPGRALTFWSDTRKGTADDNNQELALAIVDVKDGRGRRIPLVLLGVLLMAAGAGLALTKGRQPSSARPNNR